MERRKHGGLTDDQYMVLKAKLREELKPELYQELWDDVSLRVGKTVLSKGLYLFGTALVAIASWLAGSGHLKIPGAQ